MKNIESFVEPFQLSDIESLVELNKAIVPEWHHYSIKDQKIVEGQPDYYDNLSVFERWYHGGYWNDIQLFPLYYEILKKVNGQIYVAKDESDTIIGEIDFFWGKNWPDDPPIGKIGWIITHPNYRRKKIGHQLMKKMELVCKQNRITSITTTPEDDRAHHFYLAEGYSAQDHTYVMEKQPPPNKLKEKNEWKEISLAEIESINIQKWYQLGGNNLLPEYHWLWIKNRSHFKSLIQFDLSTTPYQSPIYFFQRNHKKMILTKSFNGIIYVNKEGYHDSTFLASALSTIPIQDFKTVIHQQHLELFHSTDYKDIDSEILLKKNL